MTMTREEALTIVTSIVREHARECREPRPCQDCELEAEAIAALSAQEPVAWCRDGFIYDDRGCPIGTDETAVRWQAESPGDDWRPLYAAPPAQADTKQAETLRVAREAIEALVAGPYIYHHKMNDLQEAQAKGFDRCREMTLQNIGLYFDLQSLGLRVEASGG